MSLSGTIEAACVPLIEELLLLLLFFFLLVYHGNSVLGNTAVDICILTNKNSFN